MLRGYTVFDVMPVENGHGFLWERHYDRLCRSAESIGMAVPISREVYGAAIEDLIHQSETAELVLRTVLSGGPSENGFAPNPGQETFYILAEERHRLPESVYDEGVKLITLPYERYLPQVKFANHAISIWDLKRRQTEGAVAPSERGAGRHLQGFGRLVHAQAFVEHPGLGEPLVALAQPGQRRGRQGVEGLAATPALVALQTVGLTVAHHPDGCAVRAPGLGFVLLVNLGKNPITLVGRTQLRHQRLTLSRTQLVQPFQPPLPVMFLHRLLQETRLAAVSLSRCASTGSWRAPVTTQCAKSLSVGLIVVHRPLNFADRQVPLQTLKAASDNTTNIRVIVLSETVPVVLALAVPDATLWHLEPYPSCFDPISWNRGRADFADALTDHARYQWNA